MAAIKPTPHRLARQRRTRWVFIGLLATASALLAVAGAAIWAFQSVGKTPGELLDYVERRLEGHPRLETVADIPIRLLRASFDAPRASEREALPFQVPPPPPRRGPSEVAPRPPVPASAKVWRVGPNGPLLRVAEAARLAQSGDIVEIEGGDYRGDVAVWNQTHLTIRGVNGAARLFADGQSAEGKATWVIRSGRFDIANIDFIGSKVPDGNGAGIRFEGGHLLLEDCLFWGNQMGLLTGGSGASSDATLTIRNSEFAYSHVDGRWGHNLYVGAIAELTVTGSYSHHAGRGHLLKSRARVSHVLYSRFTDESGGRASYELNFPNGGLVRVVGNVLQQQSQGDNSTMIAYGEEGFTWPVNRLSVASNTMVNDLRYGGTFVAAAPAADAVELSNNLLVGPGGVRAGPALAQWNDVRAEWKDLVRPSRYDYRLREPGERFAYRPLPDRNPRGELVPAASYVHPRAVERQVMAPLWVGALPPAPNTSP